MQTWRGVTIHGRAASSLVERFKVYGRRYRVPNAEWSKRGGCGCLDCRDQRRIIREAREKAPD